MVAQDLVGHLGLELDPHHCLEVRPRRRTASPCPPASGSSRASPRTARSPQAPAGAGSRAGTRPRTSSATRRCRSPGRCRLGVRHGRARPGPVRSRGRRSRPSAHGRHRRSGPAAAPTGRCRPGARRCPAVGYAARPAPAGRGAARRRSTDAAVSAKRGRWKPVPQPRSSTVRPVQETATPSPPTAARRDRRRGSRPRRSPASSRCWGSGTAPGSGLLRCARGRRASAPVRRSRRGCRGGRPTRP